MSRHRLERPPRFRPNYQRISTAGIALAITLLALLAGIGVIPLQGRPPAAAEAGQVLHLDSSLRSTPASTEQPKAATTPGRASGGSAVARTAATSVDSTDSTEQHGTALAAATGTGRRIVFDISDQRVWLVRSSGAVLSTYLVSGSVTHNLHPGTYSVYSRSRWAVGVDDSGVMQYFVRFAHGPQAAIGFHSIPTKLGRALQTRAQLGTPQSHGCIRQWLPDAVRLWTFAPVGTKVVVTA